MKSSWLAGGWAGALLWAACCPASSAASPAVAAAAPAATALAPQEGKIRVQLMARHAVTLSGEIAAKISALPVEEGGSFKRGQPLVEFDCGSYRAQWRKAQASLEAANQLAKVNTQLAALNSVGSLEVAQVQGKAKEAAADASYMQTVVDKCVIAAPFNGRIARRIAAVHQYVTPGNPILDIVDSGALQLRMLLPSKWLPHLKAGSSFTVTVDELGTSFPARIERLGAQIDPVSQSISAIGVIDGAGANLLPGMSGWASFKQK
jgi:RND family efflux transporter MFP subunit